MLTSWEYIHLYLAIANRESHRPPAREDRKLHPIVQTTPLGGVGSHFSNELVAKERRDILIIIIIIIRIIIIYKFYLLYIADDN